MSFVNNYSVSVALQMGATSLSLSLPDGFYSLTMVDSASTPTRWEILYADVVGGVADLQRGAENTADQEWPEGSLLYCSVTAEFLNYVEQMLNQLLTGADKWREAFLASSSYASPLTNNSRKYIARATTSDVEFTLPTDMPNSKIFESVIDLNINTGRKVRISTASSTIISAKLQNHGSLTHTLDAALGYVDISAGEDVRLRMTLTVQTDNDGAFSLVGTLVDFAVGFTELEA